MLVRRESWSVIYHQYLLVDFIYRKLYLLLSVPLLLLLFHFQSDALPLKLHSVLWTEDESALSGYWMGATVRKKSNGKWVFKEQVEEMRD